ncbi:MAG: nucleotidyltransferase domain-containing protein [Spirochaetales bacterium]|nr:nucleotidyltransferase domain-containing protein [Spirochaetales bacterium]
MDKFEIFIGHIKNWALNEPKVNSVLLVGSYARHNAKPDSDIDLVIIVEKQIDFLHNHDWIYLFGRVSTYSFEDWGRVQSIRVFYKDSFEVEYGITESTWAEIPVDQGTFQTINKGCRIVVDKSCLLKRLVKKVCLQ